MITSAEFEALVATYVQHGWLLRRVVLQDTSNAPQGLSADVPVTKSVVDAGWFSRPPRSGPIAWEIRYLGGSQYALVEYLDENSDDFDEKLHQTEQRLADAVRAKLTA
jgi:hypothetical protein